MKYTPKQYAVALYEATKDLSQAKIKEAIGQFVKMLIKANGLALLPRIIQFYADFYNKNENVVDLKITSARPLPKISKVLKENFKGVELNILSEIDENLLGGAVFQWGDTLLDVSLQKRLQNLETLLKK